jgi:hypothetical protein
MASGLVLAWVMAVAVPTAVFAQTSGIAGVVKDTSGAVMPGVTVEASSPALIERVRTVITDAQGQYKIVDLRPGTYTVTFTLPGFSTVKREGIELPATFVATVNTDLRVGALEETVTVSGASPVVDMQNVIKRQVVAKDTIDAMPTSKNWSTIGIMTIGVSSNQNDVGGSAGEHQNQLKAHGGSFNDRLVQLDGLMLANMACNYSCTGLSTNDASTQELSYEFGAISAEVAGGGVRVNIIPRDGGNRFSGSSFVNFANDKMQGNNVDDTLRSQGVPTADSILKIYDTSVAVGGPLVKDKLWFWTAHRYWGYQQIRTNTFYEKNPFDFVYDPDPNRPGTETQRNHSDDVRLTWQVSPRNKLSAYYNYAPRTTEHWTLGSTEQPEASNLQNIPLNHFETFTFRSTLTSKALFEAAMGNLSETWTREPVADAETSQGYPVTEQTTGINFRAYAANFSRNYTSLRSYRSSLTYVTGSHALKAGFQWHIGQNWLNRDANGDLTVRYRDGVPDSVIVYDTPARLYDLLKADLGLYVQDSWTLKRLTINPGLRFEYFNSAIQARAVEAGRFVPARSFSEVPDVPNWKNIAPRFGMVYDLTGDAKTALKGSINKYNRAYTTDFVNRYDPLVLQSDTRNWSDCDFLAGTSTCSSLVLPTNRDGIAQDNEIGPSNNKNLGILATRRPDPNLKRPYDIEYSLGVVRQVARGVSVTGAWYRRETYDLEQQINTLITVNDFASFTPFCFAKYSE